MTADTVFPHRPDTSNTVFPYQPNYAGPRPTPADGIRIEPERVHANASVLTGDPSEQAYTAIVHADKAFRSHIAATAEVRHRYTDSGYREQITGFATTDAVKAAERATEQVAQARQAAHDRAAKLFADLSPDGDAAAESRATRYWHRSERLLDNSDRKLIAARDLVDKATPAELGTLLQELPAWLQANNVPDDWVEAAVTHKVPEYAAARRDAARLDRAWQISQHNLGKLHQGITALRASVTPPLNPNQRATHDGTRERWNAASA